LAAGVAHDFNNILTIIQGHTDRLLVKCESNDQLAEPLRQVSAAARRASSLTRQLLMFSRKQVMQPKVIDLNVVLRNMAKMLQRLLGEDIACASKYDEALPSIEADTGMIEQVIMNLAVNSRDAMPKGGELLITTSSVKIDGPYVHQHPESRQGEFVCLSVTDNGSGMSRETLARIFEPFFTTKEVGKGTGLGLATVYGIVKQHEGYVTVDSEVGRGSTFRIYLPQVKGAALAQAAKAAPVTTPQATLPTELRAGHETILLVEDEDQVRDLTREVLEAYGYAVVAARNPVAALQAAQQHQGSLDLLLTDIVMPQMSGRQLAERLVAPRPGLRVLYMSGYTNDAITNHGVLEPDVALIEKPFTPEGLILRVRETLDSGPPRH